jgi:hypothetical protein
MGTLRLLVTKPVSRTKLLLVKFFAAAAYTLSLLIWVAVLSLLLSIWLFGTNELFVSRGLEVNILSSSDILWRYIAAFTFAAVALITVASLAFMFSTFSDNSIGPIVACVCVIIVFTILTQLQIPFYDETIKPWLFTTHMLGWKGFFLCQRRTGSYGRRIHREFRCYHEKRRDIIMLHDGVFVNSGLAFQQKKHFKLNETEELAFVDDRHRYDCCQCAKSGRPYSAN